MNDVDEIKSRLDIVDVVSGYVSLRKAGRNFKALCPFHPEKTPSFVVDPGRQSWRCFGACATGGDAFSFVMRAERLEFGDTLRLLARKAGVELQRRGGGERVDNLYGVNQEAVRFYQQVLASAEGERCRGYLQERGVNSNAVSTFQLGLSPQGRDGLMGHLLALGFQQEQAVEAGLLRRSDDGTTRDFFWGRLMIPIHDRRGRVAGFGARSMDGSDPKYINTPGTATFNKSATLYGLHLAAERIKEEGTVVIVEGYMDVIAAHQHGYSNVVASMGTALTERQVSQLKSAAQAFVLALDPDAAGQEATRRSLEGSWRLFERQSLGGRQRSVGPLFQVERPDLKIAALPPGRDPDDLIRQDPGEWERLIREAVPFMEYAIPAFAARFDLATSRGKAQAAEALLPLVASTGNAFEQERHFRKLAEVLGVSTEALEASIGSPRAGGYVGRRPSSTRAREAQRGAAELPLEADRRDYLEDYALALLLSQPDLREHAETITPEYFRNTENRLVFTSWPGSSTMDELRDNLDPSLHGHLSYLAEMDLGPVDRRSAETALAQCLRRLEQRHLAEVQEGLLETDDPAVPPPREMEDPITTVNKRLKELFSQVN